MNAEVDITNVILKTPRVVLRPWNNGDLQGLFDYASVPGVGEMAGWKHHENIEESKKILDMFIEGKRTFCIEINGKVAGSIGIEKYNETRFPELADKQGREIGFVLAKKFWGQGYMPEAVKEVIKYCFNVIGCDFLVCGHFLNNNRSARVQEKLGFKEGVTFEYTTKSGEKKQAVESILFREDFVG